MKLSKDSINILKNFSVINPGMLIKPGSSIRTISVMRNIFAKANIKEEFPIEFAIYDLPEFLAALEFFKGDVEIEFNEKNMVLSDGKNKINYFYSSPSVVVSPPDKELKMKEVDMSFELTSEMLTQIRKVAAILKLKDLKISKDGLVVLNKNSTGNSFEINTEVQSKTDDSVYINVEDFKIIDANYTVNVSTAGLIQLVCNNLNYDLEYFIAISQ